MIMRSFIQLVLIFVVLFGSQVSHSQEAPQVSDEAVAQRHGITVEDVQRLQRYRHLTNEHMIEMAPSRIGKILWRLDNNLPDLPLAAAEFRQLQQLGGDEPVPATAIGGAIDQLKDRRSRVRELAGKEPSVTAIGPNQTLSGLPKNVVAGMPVGALVAQRPQAAAAGVAPDPNLGILQLELQPLPNPKIGQPRAATAAPGGISRAKWKWLGPGNVGGRSRALVIHPKRPEIMWVASVAGGIWKTTNGGSTWGPLADFMASLNVSTLLLDPVNPDVLFAGTGEGYYNLDAYRGAGIFRSMDGGATWTQLPATATDSFAFVYRLAMTQDGATLLAATRQGLFRSTNFHDSDAAKISFQPAKGLSNTDVLAVVCHRTDPARCIAGGRGRTAYYSIDSGATWQPSTGLPNPNPGEFGGRVELTYARKDPNIVYASVDNNEGEVYRSRDGGKTFDLRSVGTGGYLSSQGWYGNTIWADDPGDENFVIVGGIELHRSLDGGATFEAISDWDKFPATAHADQHSIVSHPNYNGTTNTTVLFTNDGGVYRNDDVINTTTTSGWVSLNNNFGVTQFYGAAGNLTTGRIVGGTQDNGSVLYQPPPGPNTGPNAYTTMSYGDGGYAAADPADPNYFYGEYVYLMIQRSTNGGLKAGYIYQGIDDAGSRDKANFIAPFILDPANPNGMFAGGQSLWRSNNVRSATPSWHRIKGPIQEGLISAIAAARTENTKKWSDNLWVGYSAASPTTRRGAGQVFVSTNADTPTPTWTAVGQGQLPKRFVTRIRIDPQDAKRVYTAFSGYFPGNLWRTTDGGVKWENISKELPSVSIYDIAIHPSDSRLLYAATEVGVFASGDGGQSWWATNEGPANVVVYELFWMGDLLVAATHGRGLFWIDLSGAPQTAENVSPAAAPASVAIPEIGPAGSRGSPAIILQQRPVRPTAE
jgi:photosystem II stability/assembly factor-like uncharacterized protein